MLFGSWDRESCSCWEWMGELEFIDERVRYDHLFFLFFSVLVMGLSSWMLGLIWEEQAVKWRTSWRTWRNFFISVSFFFSFVLLWSGSVFVFDLCFFFFFFFPFFIRVVVIWVWVIGCWVWVLVAGFDWEEQEEQVVMFLWKLIMISNISFKIKLYLRFF